VQNEVPDPTPDNPDNMKPEPLIISTAIVGLFSLLYLGGCIIAAREAKLFVYRFREKVRLNEIAGLDLEDMDHFFNGLPVALPVQRSLQEQEKEFRDKAQGDGERTSRAERAGHASHTGKLEREKSGLSGGADQSPGARSRSPVAQPPPNTVTLAKTVEQSKKVYADDPERALYLLCTHKDITFAFFRERRAFSRRVVKPTHSIPLVRLMVYGWQPTVSHSDFAGILNANALYSFTVGFPQLGATLIYITAYGMDGVIAMSLAVGTFSLFLSIMNMILDFPKQLFDIAQREGEAHVFALQAEEKSEFWEKKMEVEVQQKQEYLLESTREMDDNGIQKPLSIIHDVMDLERECMRARVGYVAHQMFMSLHEAERRNAIRSGQLANPYAEKEEEDEDEEEAEEVIIDVQVAEPHPEPALSPRDPYISDHVAHHQQPPPPVTALERKSSIKDVRVSKDMRGGKDLVRGSLPASEKLPPSRAGSFVNFDVSVEGGGGTRDSHQAAPARTLGRQSSDERVQRRLNQQFQSQPRAPSNLLEARIHQKGAPSGESAEGPASEGRSSQVKSSQVRSSQRGDEAGDDGEGSSIGAGAVPSAARASADASADASYLSLAPNWSAPDVHAPTASDTAGSGSDGSPSPAPRLSHSLSFAQRFGFGIASQPEDVTA